MNKTEVLRSWRKTLLGQKSVLSIEITKRCPLKCPGCYAFGADHVGQGIDLVQLNDFSGSDLVARVLKLVRRFKPLHLSIVGGDPLVRYRELGTILPEIDKLQFGGAPVHVQVVTSAFRELPRFEPALRNTTFVVSIDGLQPEHDVRRAPATYERVLRSIEGSRITVHCTITGQIANRPGYLEEFVRFWSRRAEVEKIWFSMYTPQVGEDTPECIEPGDRRRLIWELIELRHRFTKLDMHPGVIAEFLSPPRSPSECIFAQSTRVISADLRTEVKPCQFGGNPDCSRCGCIASMGLAAVGHVRIPKIGIQAGTVFHASRKIGGLVNILTMNGNGG